MIKTCGGKVISRRFFAAPSPVDIVNDFVFPQITSRIRQRKCNRRLRRRHREWSPRVLRRPGTTRIDPYPSKISQKMFLEARFPGTTLSDSDRSFFLDEVVSDPVETSEDLECPQKSPRKAMRNGCSSSKQKKHPSKPKKPGQPQERPLFRMRHGLKCFTMTEYHNLRWSTFKVRIV